MDYIGVSAGAMIFNDKGELFLSKRSMNAKNERGCWETPGGSVEFGETLEQAVKREMKEEYGLNIEILEQFPASDHLIPKEHQHWVATTFLARPRKGQTPKIMEPEKCDAIGWFPLDKLPKPLSIITKLDLKEYKKRQQANLEELVDIVDETNIVLHATTKKKAHTEGLLHRTVIGGLKDSKGNWLLVKQANGRQDAGQYVAPVGGHVRAGETELEALYREAQEEIGFTEFDFRFIGRAVFNRKILGRLENHYFVFYEILSDELPKLNHEAVSYVTFSEEELKNRLTSHPHEFGDAFHFVRKAFYKGLLT